MDILIRGVPADELFSIEDLVNMYLKDHSDRPNGIYHAHVYGRGEVPDWKPSFAVYKIKTGVVVKWIGE